MIHVFLLGAGTLQKKSKVAKGCTLIFTPYQRTEPVKQMFDKTRIKYLGNDFDKMVSYDITKMIWLHQLKAVWGMEPLVTEHIIKTKQSTTKPWE